MPTMRSNSKSTFNLIMVVVGVFIVVAAWVLRFVFSILAFVKTKDGEDYTYPFTFTFIK